MIICGAMLRAVGYFPPWIQIRPSRTSGGRLCFSCVPFCIIPPPNYDIQLHKSEQTRFCLIPPISTAREWLIHTFGPALVIGLNTSPDILPRALFAPLRANQPFSTDNFYVFGMKYFSNHSISNSLTKTSSPSIDAKFPTRLEYRRSR